MLKMVSTIFPTDIVFKYCCRAKAGRKIDYVPAPRITEADKINDTK